MDPIVDTGPQKLDMSSRMLNEITEVSKQLAHIKIFGEHVNAISEQGPWPWEIHKTIDKKKLPWVSLRLYRLWLTKALQHRDAPYIPPTISRRKLANFWIIVGLLKFKKKSGVSCPMLKKMLTELACFHETEKKENLNNDLDFIECLGKVTSNIKNANPMDVGKKIMCIAADDSPIFTPEMDDVVFRETIDLHVGLDIVNQMMARVAYGERVYRPTKVKWTENMAKKTCLWFVAHTPPSCSYCLVYQAYICNKFISDTSLAYRENKMFIVYADQIWDEYKTH